MANKIAVGSLLAGLIFILGGCSDQYNICDLEKNSFFKAGFYQVNGGIETSNPAASFSLTSIGGSNIYVNQINATQFSVSLNPLTDSVRYYIKLSQTAPADTLTVIYTTQTVFLSAECGNAYAFTVSDSHSTHNTIDSVRITSPIVNTTSLENLRVFF